jgi:CheY-like chemotaxis protein
VSRPSTAPSHRPAEQGSPAVDPISAVAEFHAGVGDPSPSADASAAPRAYREGSGRDAAAEDTSGPTEQAAAWGDSRALAGALHEVSNALTVVLGWLDAVAESDDPAKLHAALAVAREHARRGRNLARRAIGAEGESVCEPRGAEGLARFAVMSVRPRALACGVHVELDDAEGPDVPLLDEAPALQVLTNLLLNAIDFSPAGGSVCVSVRVEADAVVFVVSDEGPGVPEERRASLFEDPVSTRLGGAGIGLPYSRRLACERGGDLRLVPTSRGACFEVVWPRASTTGLRPSASPDSTSLKVLVGSRILVVEDDAAIASLLELSLEAKGAEVLVAPGAENLAQVLAGRPVFDAALLDLSPVKEDLGRWLDEIRRQAPEAPLLLVSGHPNGVPEEAEGRFSAWVRKPFEMGELLQTLAGLLAQRVQH